MSRPKIFRLGFTLIELLIVIAIVAIISVAVILALNPTELIRQSRDANRLSDANTLNRAISTYVATGQTNLASSSVIYISIPDPTAPVAGNNCSGLSLAPPATGWTYHCSASTTYKNVDGNGWIPINFKTMSIGSALDALPADPINTTSGLFYTFAANSNGTYALTTLLESSKYLKPIGANASNYDLARYVIGTNYPLVGQSEGLVRNWPFDEGAGAVTAEVAGASVPADTGNFSSCGSSCWTSGKIGPSAAQLQNGATIAYTTTNALPASTTMSVAAWVAVTGAGPGTFTYLSNNYNSANHGSWQLWSDSSSNVWFGIYNNSGVAVAASGCSAQYTGTNYHFLVGTYDGQNVRVYLDGQQCGSAQALANQTLYTGGTLSSSNAAGAGKIVYFDDMRVYSRPLPASEISSLYTASN